MRVKIKHSWRPFHDEGDYDEGQGQLTSPNEDQKLRMMKTEDSARTMMKARSTWRLCEEQDDEFRGLFKDEGWGAFDDSLTMTMMKAGDSLTMMNLGDPSKIIEVGSSDHDQDWRLFKNDHDEEVGDCEDNAEGWGLFKDDDEGWNSFSADENWELFKDKDDRRWELWP
ncbi:unnamed protein product [Coccothraustes coccothraustes]